MIRNRSEKALLSQGGWITLTLFILLIVFAVALLLGRYPKAGLMSPALLQEDPLAQKLLLNLRLPRVLTALLLGMALSGAGMVFQMIFANPLVEPGFLGVSQGAAFGASVSIVFVTTSIWAIQGFAASFAILGLGFSYFIARKVRFGGWVIRLILAGISVSALFTAGIGILKYIADPVSQLPEITFWMLGGLWNITWREYLTILPIVAPSLIIIYLMRWRLNLLCLNDETSFSLGIAPGRERIVFLLLATLATASVISVSGIVGWVGLIVPHIARRLYRSDTRYALTGSMLLGGMFTLICDSIARTVLMGEIPLGILTSAIGATIFMALLMTRTVKVEK
ncbi:MAG: iron ABC transporter permease [Spirochaetales bacterium]|nr:iron ABC transporter permease [Spirochaetales bacterium]